MYFCAILFQEKICLVTLDFGESLRLPERSEHDFEVSQNQIVACVNTEVRH